MIEYYKTGAIVQATSGREKGERFVILDTDKNYVYLINGKTRPVENPKKKNIKHLHLLCKSDLVESTIFTNQKTIEILKKFDKSSDCK